MSFTVGFSLLQLQRPITTSVLSPNTDYTPVTTAMSTPATMADWIQSSRSYSSFEKRPQDSPSQLSGRPNVPHATTRDEESRDQTEMMDAISRLERRMDTMQQQMLPPGYS
jgi:hypothetical protein